MDLATLALFLPACFALNMAPGPNNLLSVSNATRYGYRVSCLAVSVCPTHLVVSIRDASSRIT